MRYFEKRALDVRTIGKAIRGRVNAIQALESAKLPQSKSLLKAKTVNQLENIQNDALTLGQSIDKKLDNITDRAINRADDKPMTAINLFTEASNAERMQQYAYSVSKLAKNSKKFISTKL